MYLYAAGGAGGAGGGQAPAGNLLGVLFPFILIFVIFYFIIIMPARKKQKQHQGMINALQGGERVVTAGGIYGTISRVLDDRFEVQVDKNTKIQVAKSSVSSIVEPGGTGTGDKESLK
jgi:preprotein translocase subunit YajC